MQLFYRRHSPGTAPGTIAEFEPPREPARISLVSFGIDSLTELDLTTPDDISDPAPGLSRWIDVQGQDATRTAELGQRLGIHPLALEDVINLGQRTKSEDFEDSLFIVMNHFSIEDETGSLAREQISLIIQENTVLSVRELHSELFEPVLKRLRSGRVRIRGGGPGYLAYTLIDTVVDHLFPVLESIGDRIEDVESSLLEKPTPEILNTLHGLKRELLMLRKSVWPLRDMLSSLQHTDNAIFSEETRVYLRDATDHTIMAVEIVETLREMVSSMMDLYLSSLSNKMNEIMKVLTIIATIFIPLGFIAGLYGMNFERSASPYNMPELGWYWGYPAAIGLMALVAGGLLIFFRRRGWI